MENGHARLGHRIPDTRARFADLVSNLCEKQVNGFTTFTYTLLEEE
jgi:hypothetical protein